MVGESDDLAVNFEGQGGKWSIEFVIQRDIFDGWMDHGSEGRPAVGTAGPAEAEMGKDEFEGSRCPSHSQWPPQIFSLLTSSFLRVVSLQWRAGSATTGTLAHS